MYDPEHNSWQEGLPMEISKTLKRRYFLVEKAKNANVIGVLQHCSDCVSTCLKRPVAFTACSFA